MTKSQNKQLPKLVLSSSRDIPFSQLVLSQRNVRRVKAGLSIEDLADDIYRRTLLQSLNVRALLDDDGKEAGQFEVPAGGRRFRALELLVKSKRMAKDQPVPCVVREAGIAEEDSLAENVMRVGLHPLDQFRAFSALIEAGLSEDDIAARFFVSVSTVRQRLRLASVSPSLLDVYGEDGMSLEQRMAFSVTDNHERQEQVWEQVNKGHHIPAYHIRRLLTEHAIAANDRRVRFIGIDAYIEAGGYVMRDLFSTNDDGWLQEPALVELLVNEKLSEIAQEIGAEDWKWVEAAIDLPFGCERGKRRITGTTVPLTDEEQARLDALIEEYDAIGEQYRDGCDLPDEVDARLTEIDAEMTPLTSRPVVFEPDEQARAGVFVSLTHDGRLRIDRGYVRPEDEPVAEDADVPVGTEAAEQASGPAITVSGHVQNEQAVDDDDDAIRPLPDRLAAFLSDPKRSFESTLAAMMMTAHLGDGGVHPVVASAARELLNKSENERSGVLSTAMSFLGLYRDPVVAQVTRQCDWRIADLVDAKRPATLYLVIPPSDISRTKPLIRLLLNQIGRRLTEELAPDAKRQRVLIMLDEFPALGRLDFFESALAFMAGYGLKAFLIAQSLNQIEHAYGQNNAILDNCHVRVCFATNDERTAKRVSESLGTATELRAMKNYAGHRLSPWLGHLMISKSETARSLLTPGEIQELPKTDEIVMMAGAHPIRAKKAQYFRDKRLSARVLSPPKVRAASKEASAPHDWLGLIAKVPAEAQRGPKLKAEHDNDPQNAGIRTEPELPIHEESAPPPKPVAREFDFDRDEQNDDDAARNRRLQDRMRGNARRASLDPGDGIEL